MDARKYTILVDGGADLPAEALARQGILVVPLHYQFQNDTYASDPLRPMDMTSFYFGMRQGAPVKTFPALPEAFLGAWEVHIKEGRDILQLTMSRNMSATFKNALMARTALLSDYPDARIVVVDTLSCSIAEGMLAYEAASLREEGANIDEVANWVVQNRNNVNTVIMPEKLDYIKAGGHFQGSHSIFSKGIILKITEDGKLASIGQYKNIDDGIDFMIEHIFNTAFSLNTQVVSVAHADATSNAHTLAQLLKDEASVKDVGVFPIGPASGCHIGPGTISLSYFGAAR